MHILKEPGLSTPGDIIPGDAEASIAEALAGLVGEAEAALLLRRIGANGLLALDAEQIAASSGLSHETAERITAARRFGDLLYKAPRADARDALRLLCALPKGFARFETEMLVGVALSARLQVKATVVLSVGGASQLTVHAPDVFTPLLRHGARAFALAHNHPSGDPTPSSDDVTFTNSIAAGARVLGLPLVDHLVVARDGVISMNERNLLPHAAELN